MEVCAYEIERQRSKRTEELTKRKAKKTSQATVGGADVQIHSRGLSESGVGLVLSIGRKNSSREIEEAMDEAKLPSIRKDGHGLSSFTVGAVPSNGHTAMEVSLSDFIVPSHRKPRKGKGTLCSPCQRDGIADHGPADDFEMVPPVRSVIVLDDMFESKDMDMDEAWEHIDHELEFAGAISKPKETASSYAAVLAAANA